MTLCDCQLDSFEPLALFNTVLHELMQPLSYFFLLLSSLAPRNLKRFLNVFWPQVLGLGCEAQVLVDNTGDRSIRLPTSSTGWQLAEQVISLVRWKRPGLQQVANFFTILIALLVTYLNFWACLTSFLTLFKIKKWNLIMKMW